MSYYRDRRKDIFVLERTKINPPGGGFDELVELFALIKMTVIPYEGTRYEMSMKAREDSVMIENVYCHLVVGWLEMAIHCIAVEGFLVTCPYQPVINLPIEAEVIFN